jgi:hypothetical protein
VVPIRDSRDIFYRNFQVGIKVDLVGYGDINLGFATLKQVKAKARVKVHAKIPITTTYRKLTNNKKGGEGGGGGGGKEKCFKVLVGSTKEEGGGFGKK